MSLNLSANKDDFISAFRKNVDMFISEKDITIREVSEVADIPFSTLNTFLYTNATDCKLSTAIKLARAFNCSIDELIGAETIDKMQRESIAMCRNMPDHVVYLIRSFIRHHYTIYSALDEKSTHIPVLLPECQNGSLETTNITDVVCIDNLSDDIKSRVVLGLKIPCEHYEPYYMPGEIILLAADRDGRHNEKCVVCYKGKYFIARKQIVIENKQKKVKYISILDSKTEVLREDIDDKVGYIVGFLDGGGNWGMR